MILGFLLLHPQASTVDNAEANMTTEIKTTAVPKTFLFNLSPPLVRQKGQSFP
jgi:hypothetical protein